MPLGRPLVRFDRVGSTMDVAASLARSGAGEGTCVVAGYQESGQGRANRSWNAPPGSALLCSVLLRPALPLARLTPMAMLTADAIASAIEGMTGVSATIKWPNDVLVDGRKLSGVLIQTINAGEGRAMIVGFGVNANTPADSMPDGATSLLRETGKEIDLTGLRRAILLELERRYSALVDDGIAPFWDGVERRVAMRGERVVIVDGEREVTGILRGIDTDGSLFLDDSGGTRRIVSGDLVRGPRIRR